MADTTNLLLEKIGSPPTRVLVCGGRDFENYDLFVRIMDRFWMENVPISGPTGHRDRCPLTLISGGARGADKMAERYAIFRGHDVEVFEPDWLTYGNSAGPIRNQQMLDEGKPDLVIAFPGGTGTANMIELAEKAGVKVVRIDGI